MKNLDALMESLGAHSVTDCLGNKVYVGTKLSSDAKPERAPSAILADIQNGVAVVEWLHDEREIRIDPDQPIRIQDFAACKWVRSNDQGKDDA